MPKRFTVSALGLTALAAVGATLLVGPLTAGQAHLSPPPPPPLAANADSYATPSTGTLAIDRRHGVLANDTGGAPLQIVSHTDPAHGSVTLNADGSFNYVPQLGFTGADSFSYAISDAVHLYTTHVAPIGNFGGVALSGGAFGSSLAPVPGRPDEVYGLEDRGPNVAAPNGDAVEPIPSYDPAIAKFRLVGDRAVLKRMIPLRDGSGHPYSGLVNTAAPTGETIEDLNGNKLAHDPNGYDPEGLVALPDGTFWVSDEYGPFITHFDAFGRQIGRLSPFDGSLPGELVKRVPNRGLEGLTITPDGKTLVAMMQSALQQTDLSGSDAKKVVPVRIVTYDLRHHALHEYLFLLSDPKTNATAVSEITALSNTQFVVDERDGNFPTATGFKKLWKIDVTGATDVGPGAKVAGATYDAANGGLLVGGKTIEALTVGQTTAQTQTTLAAAHITPVSSTLDVDLDSLLLSLDPQGRFFSHDKIEGEFATDGGREIVISNDSDFGISGVTNTAPPWKLQVKTSPTTGKQDDGEYLAIDTTKLTETPSTGTVTINVGP